MKITALDIRKQEFARTFRGYDPDEVDSFMQVVATGWQEMVDDLRRSQEKIDEQRMKLEHYMKVEEALEEALQTARSSARQTIESAEKKATDLLEDAENRIVSLQKEADANRLEIKRETARYAVRQQEIVAKLRAFLVSEMEMLRHFESDSGERTLQQPTSLREIEMYRDEAASRTDEPDEASGEADLDSAPLHPGREHAAEDVLSESDAYDEEDSSDWAEQEEESDDDVQDEYGEDGGEDWEEDGPDDDVADRSESISHNTDHGQSGEVHHDDVRPDHEHDNAYGDEEQNEGSEDEREDAPGWRVTPVFESADDGGDSHESRMSDLDALPDDGADDEIKKIHEILKGLDEEQDGDED